MQFGWRTGPDTHAHRAAGAIFRGVSGWSEPAPSWLWSGVIAAGAAAAAALHWWPEIARRLADGLARAAPAVFAPGTAAPGIVETQGICVLAALVMLAAGGANLMWAWRRRRGLAAGFLAAEARLGEPYVGTPGQVFASLAFVLLWHLLIAGPVVELVWTLVAAKAATGLAVRLLVARGERATLAAGLARGSVRGLGFAGCLVLAVALAGRAWLSAPGPRPALADETPPPALRAGWNAAVAASVDGRDVSAAMRSVLEVGRGGQDAAVLADLNRTLEQVRDRAAARAAELRVPGFSMADLAAGAIDAGEVAGSDGSLAYRVALRREVDRDLTEAGIFRRDGAMWRLSARAELGHATVERPELVTSPDGPLLVIRATAENNRAVRDAVYRREGPAWRWIETGTWLRQAAHALPPGACLLGAEYEQVAALAPPSPRDATIRPDYAALRAVAFYGPDPQAAPGPDAGRLDASLNVANGFLVLTAARLVPPTPARAWFARVLAPAPQC